ncbi:hypothetical protein TcG_11608 [Trypanosoma cruzi]|nr:hypothetical protein TcG_11608 [Trypanosoma cruzi]
MPPTVIHHASPPHIFRGATPLILLQPLWFRVLHAFHCATIHPLVWPPHPNSGAQHRVRQSTSLHVPTLWYSALSQALDSRRVLCRQYNTQSCSERLGRRRIYLS